MIANSPSSPVGAQNSHAAVLLIHGFTGSRAAMAPWAQSLESHGLTTAVPRLPGHETQWPDLIGRPYSQWIQATEDAFDQLAETHKQVYVAGLSMGGALALHLATRRHVAGLSLVNPGLVIDSPLAPWAKYLRFFVRSTAAIGNDIALPGADEKAYPRAPVAAAAQLHELFAQTRRRLPLVKAPVQLFRSATDNIVSDRSVHELTFGLAPGILREYIALPLSKHVATLDYDASTIFDESLRFISELTVQKD